MKKNNNFGFIVICPVFNEKQIIATLKSLDNHHKDIPVVVSCYKKFTKEQVAFIKIQNLKNNVIAKATTEIQLLESGINDSIYDWNIVLVSGDRVKYKIDKKYEKYREDENNVLYLVSRDKMYYHESRWTGNMYNRNSYKSLGGIPNLSEDMSNNKVVFEGEGLERGYKFIGLVNCNFSN